MKFLFVVLLFVSGLAAYGDTPDISLPQNDVDLIKTTDFVEVTGTSNSGAQDDFTIHDWKAIKQFVALMTSERFTAVPKSLKPEFVSKSLYKVRLSAKGAPILELQVIADSIVDIPNDPSYYMQSDRHSDNLLAPLLRLR